MKSSPALPAVLLSAFLLSATANTAESLPEKAFDVDDGVVAVVAGVMPNPAAPSTLPIGKLKYPTRYFVELRNESPYPLWLDATWTFPGKGKAVESNTVRSKKVPAGVSYTFFSDKLGVIVDQPILVDIQAWSEEKRINLIGSQQAEMQFDQASVDTFIQNFPSAFKGRPNDYRKALVISGWRDLPAPRTDVPGTLADETLQADVQRLIWKFDTRKRWACEREIIGAAAFDVSDSEMLSSLPAETRQQSALDQFNDTLIMEKWTIRSCGQQLTYEVMMSASSSGGSHIAVFELPGGQSSQNWPEIAPAD